MFRRISKRKQMRLEAIKQKLIDNKINWVGMESIVHLQMEASKGLKSFGCVVFPKDIEESKIIGKATNITEDRLNRALWMAHLSNYQEAKTLIDEEKEKNAEYLKSRLKLNDFEYYLVVTDKNGKDIYII